MISRKNGKKEKPENDFGANLYFVLLYSFIFVFLILFYLGDFVGEFEAPLATGRLLPNSPKHARGFG